MAIESTMSDNLGGIIRQRRLSLSKSLRHIAAESGVSKSYLDQIETGERFPSGNLLKKIAKPLGFEVDELFSLAGYLPSRPPSTADQSLVYFVKRLDPYAARLLAQKSVEMQRSIIGVLAILKNIAREYQRTADQSLVYVANRLDPYSAKLLAQEPVEIQRTVIGVLAILKNIAREYQRNINFAEYVRSNYSDLDEDIITMVDDLMKNRPGRKRDDETSMCELIDLYPFFSDRRHPPI